MDFRLGFGAAFGEDTEVVMIDSAEPAREAKRAVAERLYGALPGTLDALTGAAAGGSAADRAG